jgi:hypothetical protein
MSSDPYFAQSLARAICYVMTENLLSVLPTIDDYTCPVCASITFKPGTISLAISDHSAVGMFPCVLHSVFDNTPATAESELSNLSSKRSP